MPARQHMVQDCANPVNIRPDIGLLPASILFRRRIALRTQHFRIPRGLRFKDSAGSVIDQNIASVLADQNIGRLKIPIDQRRVRSMQLPKDRAER